MATGVAGAGGGGNGPQKVTEVRTVVCVGRNFAAEEVVRVEAAAGLMVRALVVMLQPVDWKVPPVTCGEGGGVRMGGRTLVGRSGWTVAVGFCVRFRGMDCCRKLGVGVWVQLFP